MHRAENKILTESSHRANISKDRNNRLRRRKNRHRYQKKTPISRNSIHKKMLRAVSKIPIGNNRRVSTNRDSSHSMTHLAPAALLKTLFLISSLAKPREEMRKSVFKSAAGARTFNLR